MARWCDTACSILSYLRFERAGVYTVRSRTTGWGPPTRGRRPRRSRSPCPPRRRPSRSSPRRSGRRTIPAASPGRPAAPRSRGAAPYLAPLEARAQKGGYLAALVAAIGAIATTDATRVLLRLARSADAKVATAAAHTLAARVPDLEEKLGPRYSFGDRTRHERAYLVDATWRPELAGDVRPRGSCSSARGIPTGPPVGGSLLQALGTREDPPALALDQVRATATLPFEGRMYPRPRGSCRELVRTVEAPARRGVILRERPRTPGELAAWLTGSRAPRLLPGVSWWWALPRMRSPTSASSRSRRRRAPCRRRCGPRCRASSRIPTSTSPSRPASSPGSEEDPA